VVHPTEPLAKIRVVDPDHHVRLRLRDMGRGSPGIKARPIRNRIWINRWSSGGNLPGPFSMDLLAKPSDECRMVDPSQHICLGLELNLLPARDQHVGRPLWNPLRNCDRSGFTLVNLPP
jgi:hypothetical protein